MAVNLRANHFRFGIDELAESTHGWHANEDVNPAQGVIAVDTTFLLRFNVQETGGTAAGNTDFQFQYNRNGVGWVNITTTSGVVKAVAAAALTNGGACTKRLSGTGTFESSGAGQTEDGTSGGAANDIAASGCSETECGLQIVGADVAGNDSIQFRLISPDFAITMDVTPTVTTPVTGFTLTADAGSYAHTGTAATLLAGRKVTADVGSYALTGAAATLRAAFKLAVDTGAYSWTGSAATLSFGYRLTLDPGSYATTGTAASLLASLRLAAGAGSHILTGTAAGLLKHSVLSVDAGSYTMTGIAAALLRTRVLQAVAGVYGIIGTATPLLAARKFPVDAGNYTITGTTAKAVLDVFPVSGGAIIIND